MKASALVLTFIVASLYYPVSANNSDLDFWDSQYRDLQRKLKEKKALAKTTAGKSIMLNRNALILPGDGTPCDVLLRRTRLLLDDLKSKKKSSKWTEYEQKLNALQSAYLKGGLAKTSAQSEGGSKEIFMKISALSKQVALENPLLDFDDLLFVGYMTTSNHMVTQYVPWKIKMGGGLYILKGFKTSNPVLVDVLKNSKVENGPFQGSNLSGGGFISPDLSYDGKTILFAWSPPKNPCYHIFKVNIDGSNLVQLTDGVATKEDHRMNASHNDFDPIWLPNGRIVFISDRRGGHGRCHPGPKPTYTMASMKDDGSDIVFISYHETNEWHPSVDNDGYLVYTRWDYVDRDDCIAHHMWICYPDGRDPRSYHGNYPLPLQTFTGSDFVDQKRNRPFAEFNIRAIPNSQKYVATAAGHHGLAFGDLIVIDPSIEDDGLVSQVKKITDHFPEGKFPDGRPGPYGTAWPLSEDYYICNNENAIILLDKFGGEKPIYSSKSYRPIDPIPVKARTKPPAIPTATWQGERKGLSDHKRATISVNDVYTGDIPLPANTVIKQMRIVQIFPKETPKINNPKNGYPSEALVRMSLGTAPVESDGSVYCEAPVGKTIYFQLIDDKGLAVQSMRSATYVHEGEQMVCVGCHENKWEAPVGGIRKAFSRPPSPLTPDAGGVEPANFARLVQPVFQEKCVSCHKSKKGPDMSFKSLRDYAFYFCSDGGYLWDDLRKPEKGGSRTTPGKFGAAQSKLIKYLNSSHYDVSLTSEEYRRITLWLDLNSMELGAEHDLDKQRRGELVWPLIDATPENPQGTEADYPLPGLSKIFKPLPVQSARLIRNGSVITLFNPDAVMAASLFDVSGRLIHEWRFEKAEKTVQFDLNALLISKGVYNWRIVSLKAGKNNAKINSNVEFILQ